MRPTQVMSFIGLATALALAGCANGSGSNLTTASVKPQRTAAPVVDPACRTLAAKIDEARREGTPARVHAIANGKTKTANVKRTSIAKAAELDRLNQEFQMKCSKVPVQQTAAAPKAAAPITGSTALKTAQTAQDTVAKARAAQKAAKLAKSATTATSTPIVAVPKQ